MAEDNRPQQIGKYLIQEVLGRGAMGVVYKGFDPHIERTVAIKVIRKAAFADDELREALGRFKREAQAAGRLIHPNIVTVYEYGEENDTAFIAMEYVEGDSLKERLDAKTSFRLAEVKEIISQLLTGLAHAHASGIVHRDIKPDNLIFAPDNTLKIMDFGVARLESSSLTMAGSVMGTPAYMAPEMFSGEAIDQRSDLFSAGIILYQLLTGHKPFGGSSLTTIMHQVVNVMPALPSTLDNRLPPPLDTLIQTCLAKNPAERFQDAGDFLAALDRAFARVDTTLIIKPGPPPADTGHDATMLAPGQQTPALSAGLAVLRRLPLPLLLAGGGLLMVLIIAVVLWLASGEPQPGQDSPPEILSSEHKKGSAEGQPPKIISPTSRKKEVQRPAARPQTGITIITPGNKPQPARSREEPASRNAITITVPDR